MEISPAVAAWPTVDARVARVTALAEDAFRDREMAWRWLLTPKQRFGGKSPLSMLTTESGATAVEEVILQVRYGFTA
jgi:putative toxin-antitoxin system antitoxin component (TIGR02293 family)